MKRLTLSLLIMTFLISLNSEAFAAWWKKKEKKETITQEQPAQPQVKQEAPRPVEVKDQARAAQEKKKQMLASKLAALNNTEWSIELSAAAGKEKKQVSLVFKDSKVASTFSPADFPATNFTPTYNDDGSLLLETMQTSEKVGILFWRIEVSADMSSMKGLVAHQLPNNTTKDYNFVSRAKMPLSANR